MHKDFYLQVKSRQGRKEEKSPLRVITNEPDQTCKTTGNKLTDSVLGSRSYLQSTAAMTTMTRCSLQASEGPAAPWRFVQKPRTSTLSL